MTEQYQSRSYSLKCANHSINNVLILIITNNQIQIAEKKFYMIIIKSMFIRFRIRNTKRAFNSLLQTSWYVTRCLHAQRSTFGFTLSRSHCPVSGDEALLDRATPDPTFFFLKYLAHFTIGIACAFWTVNGKTVLSYGNFCGRIFYGISSTNFS